MRARALAIPTDSSQTLLAWYLRPDPHQEKRVQCCRRILLKQPPRITLRPAPAGSPNDSYLYWARTCRGCPRCSGSIRHHPPGRARQSPQPTTTLAPEKRGLSRRSSACACLTPSQSSPEDSYWCWAPPCPVCRPSQPLITSRHRGNPAPVLSVPYRRQNSKGARSADIL